MDTNILMKNIETFGDKYIKRYLSKEDKEKLNKNWWYALNFFFSKSFMRGRKDELSNEYFHFSIRTLKDYFSITDKDLDGSYERLKKKKEYFDKKSILKFKKDKNIRKGNSIKHQNFKKEVAEKNPIINLFITPKEVEVIWDDKTYNKKIFLGNEKDIMMVLDVLKFISSDIEKKNIYTYVKNKMINNSVEEVYKELKSPNIFGIGDKIAALVIRDIILINPEISRAIKKQNIDKKKQYLKYAFPVDTWVARVAKKNLGSNKEKFEEIKEDLIDRCLRENIDPLKFAAGLWYVGYHSFDILFEYFLGKHRLGEVIS